MLKTEREYFENGKIKKIYNRKEGRLHGNYLEFYANGNIAVNKYYTDGKLDGDYEEYNEDGTLKEKAYFIKGVRQITSETSNTSCENVQENKDIDMENVSTAKYEKNYSDESFWEKVGGAAKKVGMIPLSYALALYYLMQKDTVTYAEKIMIVGCLGYFICPLDIIFDGIPVAGYTDDAAALLLLLKKLVGSLDDEVIDNVHSTINEWFEVSREDIAEILLKTKDVSNNVKDEQIKNFADRLKK